MGRRSSSVGSKRARLLLLLECCGGSLEFLPLEDKWIRMILLELSGELSPAGALIVGACCSAPVWTDDVKALIVWFADCASSSVGGELVGVTSTM